MYMYPSHSISHSLSLPHSFFLSLPHRRDRNRSRSASSSRSSDRDRDDKKGGKGRGRSDSRADEEDLKKKSSRDEPDDGESLFAAIPMIDTSYCLSLSLHLSLSPSISLSYPVDFFTASFYSFLPPFSPFP
jgi:hypothetical protein